MRIVVLATDIPYPPHRGGRADVWRRIQAMRALGHDVFLVNAHEAAGPVAPTDEHLRQVDAVVNGRCSLLLKRSPWRTVKQLALAWRTPWHTAMRVPDADERRVLMAALDAFKPDLLWLEGPWFGRLVLQLQAVRSWPLAYRSHNVEHVYLRRQARAAVRQRDHIAWTLACVGVARLEKRLMRAAAAVFDISMDDLAFWRAQGIERLHWLPPLPQAAVEPPRGDPVPGDVVFVGNLSTPNNVRGVEFLLRQVLPLLRQQVPAVRIVVVGSHPTPHAAALLAEAEALGVEKRLNVPDPLPHLLGARVLVNPVLTGSGVQLKVLDMLMTDAPIVTSRQGASGLPPEVTRQMVIADGAAGFAQALAAALQAQPTRAALAERAAARRLFTVDAVADALTVVRAAVRGPVA